jgi:carbamoyltransferase
MRILGISPYHDSSVAVYSEAGLEFYSKEERLTRKKRQPYPLKSFELAIATVGPIDLVVIAAPGNSPKNIGPVKKHIADLLGCPIVEMSDTHHLQHASLAFYNSGFDEALVFVCDRNGSYFEEDYAREGETVFTASYPCDFNTITKNYWLYNVGQEASVTNKQFIEKLDLQGQLNFKSCFSIVKVYETATSLIGQHPLENGKTMGLSSYGNKANTQPLFRDKYFPIDHKFSHDKKSYYGDSSVAINSELDALSIDKVTPENYQPYADYALNVQLETQEALKQLIAEHLAKTPIKKVCVTGGYGLNIVANTFVAEAFPDVEFYFEPLADDSGNSIGGAMYHYHKMTLDRTVKKIEHTFINGVKHDLSVVNNFENVESTVVDVNFVVDLLVQQKSVAVFNGLAESGPRALGNRSILFDARNPHAKDIVNVIKKREWYRPFAAMILQEDLHEYFEKIANIEECRFMTLSYSTRPEKIKEIGGVVHADGTTRIQTVTARDGICHDILTRFKVMTGCPLLLNTSFNLAGEPLVDTPEDAMRTLLNCDLDFIWFAESGQLFKKS